MSWFDDAVKSVEKSAEAVGDGIQNAVQQVADVAQPAAGMVDREVHNVARTVENTALPGVGHLGQELLNKLESGLSGMGQFAVSDSDRDNMLATANQFVADNAELINQMMNVLQAAVKGEL